jgi:ubiquinone/menaquinone biosynthesis C-methylase UbiE
MDINISKGAEMSRLNAAELSMMNTTARRLSHRFVELRAFQRLLRRADIDLTGARILDAGCGSGYGLELLSRAFRPSRLVGLDLMPEQIERARRRELDAEIRVGDITAIDEPDASFDAVFVFGILHHVPAWRAAMTELARVLTPGGVLLIEELHGKTAELSDRYLGTSHPIAARFDWPAFRAGLGAAGLEVIAERGLLFSAARSFAARRSVM